MAGTFDGQKIVQNFFQAQNRSCPLLKLSSPNLYTYSIVPFQITLGGAKLLLQLLSSITITCPKLGTSLRVIVPLGILR